MQTQTTTKKKAKPTTQIIDEGAIPSTAAKKPAAKRARGQTKKRIKAVIGADERHRLIAESAYLEAEKRGFEGGDPVQDWLKAESHIDSLYVLER